MVDPVVGEPMPRAAGVERSVESEDSSLAAALEAGDKDRVMEILVAQHGDHIYRYCRRMLGDVAEADDVSQTVFVQAFQGLTDLIRVRNVRAWLLGIARHRCLDRLKSVRRRARVVDNDDLAAERIPACQAETSDPREARALDDCLDHLDMRSRAVLVLRFHDELSYEDMSELIADTPGALRVRLVRALAALRRCLELKGVQP